MIPPPPIHQVTGAPHYTAVYPKRQLFGHATVSPTSAHEGFEDGTGGDFAHWAATRIKHRYCLGTFCIGSADGRGFQGFPSTAWAHHLGITSRDFARFGLPNINRKLNRESIGYEFDCLGPMEPAPDRKDHYWTVVPEYQASKKVGAIRVHERDIVYYAEPFRGYHYFERFTPEQIAYAEQMFRYLCAFHGIPTDYNEDQWDLSERALRGTPGIWQHVSVRADKSDCHPQPELIAMLKRLHPKKTIITVPKIPLVYTPEGLKHLEVKRKLRAFMPSI